ncbi:hypothetical protein [Haliangium ochraceum]|uniref:DUF4276 family protein n=1 Tax=Haliangium ochraceum (strain DSM 14365 / JCM 11303 / SMP-2) TaxID=502025 RepID=D0LJL6_HALO1|nr:hypothetical protein [Haliangium ochraceum]ACY16590.1 conserved hypothetical protein [Haliangium ochraceum DSM 14365]
MSVNVLVIPEDFRKDRYVLKPIITEMMRGLGVRARVRVCSDPLLGGLGEALKWERISEILERYQGMVRLFLLIVDRDGDERREAKLRELETRARGFLRRADRVFLGENAWQEVEVWLLAGLKDLPKAWQWSEVRAERDPKERFYDDYARKRGLQDSPYEGRAALANEAAKNYLRIRKLCPDDVAALEQRIRAALVD